MKEDDFAAAVRRGTGKFQVNAIALHAKGKIIRVGKGSLAIVSDGYELEFDVGGKQIPQHDKMVWNESDFWSVTGQIEGDLKFRSKIVSPTGRRESWRAGRKPRVVQKLHFKPIELLPSRADALTKARVRRLGGIPKKPKSKRPKVQFEATLLGCAPLFINAGTTTEIRNDFLGKTTRDSNADTFIDRARDYDFALIHREEDLVVHLRSKFPFKSLSEESDCQRFRALLNAVGFVHGFHPWPFRIQYWRGGRKVTDYLMTGKPVVKTIHAPFAERFGLSNPIARKGAVNSPIRIAARFFEENSETSKQISELLYLFREAGGRSNHLQIQTLAMCAIFEGLVNLLFDVLKLANKLRKTDPDFNQYTVLREQIMKLVAEQPGSQNSRVVRRILGSLSGKEAFRVEDKFRSICDHFFLAEPEMRPHFNAWNAERHPLSHGKFRSRDTDFRRQGLIAGAINILILKLMGFSGRAQVDIFSDQPRRTI
jgi:hypothetical protein